MRALMSKASCVVAAGLCCAVLFAYEIKPSWNGQMPVYSGTDELGLDEVPPPGGVAGIGPGTCNEPDANCQDVGRGGNAADFAFQTADDFRTGAVGGNLTHICVWGGYFASSCNNVFPSAFTVRIYLDDAANGSPHVPGTLFREIVQDVEPGFGTANVVMTDTGLDTGAVTAVPPCGTAGIAVDLYEYNMDLSMLTTPITLAANTCYWLEVRNFSTTQWLWEAKRYAGQEGFGFPVGEDAQGNNFKAQDLNRNNLWDPGDITPRDMAFCLNFSQAALSGCSSPTAPTNNACANAELITCGQTVTAFNTYGFPTVPTDNPSLSCVAAAQGFAPLWYRFNSGSNTSALVRTCASPERLDTVVAIYSATGPACAGLTEIANSCVNDSCGVVLQQSEAIARNLTPNTEYYIQVAGRLNTNQGQVVTELVCPAPPLPGNDVCGAAVALAVGGTPTPGTTVGAARNDTPPAPAAACGGGLAQTGPGVWYSVLGDGTTLTATMCSGDNNVDTVLTVMCGYCNSVMTCVAGDDDGCAAGGPSTVAWCSSNGVRYYLLVHGFLESTGTHEIVVTSDMTQCSGAVACACAGQLAGNSNGDSQIDNFDIDAFVAARLESRRPALSGGFAGRFVKGFCLSDRKCSCMIL